MRDIAEAAGCKTPTVYHHYKSKEQLFDEVVRQAYLELIAALSASLPRGLHPAEYCTASLIQKKQLTPDDLLVHRLALKTWLGCEGCDEVRQRLIAWEQARSSSNEGKLAEYLCSPAWARIITRVFMELTIRIILFDDQIDEAAIREEMDLVFKAATDR